IERVRYCFPVALLVHDIVRIAPRLGLGLRLDDVRRCPDRDLATVFLTGELAVRFHLRLVLLEAWRTQRDKGEVAILAGEVATALGAAGIHDSRIRLLNRLWLQIAFDDLV